VVKDPLTQYPAGHAYWNVQCTGMTLGAVGTVAAKTLDTANDADYACGAIVDSGTSELLMGTNAFNALVSELTSAYGAVFKQIFGVTPQTFFVDQTGSGFYPASKTEAQINAVLPPLIVTLGTGSNMVTVTLPACSSYLMPVQPQKAAPNSGFTGTTAVNWMSGVADSGTSDNAAAGGCEANVILGWPFMNGMVVAFDMGKLAVGFAPGIACDATSPGALSVVGGVSNFVDSAGGAGVSGGSSSPTGTPTGSTTTAAPTTTTTTLSPANCAAKYCSGHGACSTNWFGRTECVCNGGYSGYDCSTVFTTTTPKPGSTAAPCTLCQNGGTAVAGCTACACPAGYTGFDCSCSFLRLGFVLSLDMATVTSASTQAALISDLSTAFSLGSYSGTVAVESVTIASVGGSEAAYVSIDIVMCGSGAAAALHAVSSAIGTATTTSKLQSGSVSQYMLTGLQTLPNTPPDSGDDSTPVYKSSGFIGGIIAAILIVVIGAGVAAVVIARRNKSASYQTNRMGAEMGGKSPPSTMQAYR
jgi:hypothetical protein